MADDATPPADPTPSVGDLVNPQSDAPTAIDTGDNQLVVTAKLLMAEFEVKNKKPGKQPKMFEQSARAVKALTDFVITNPKVPVLDAMLDFFKAHSADVCAASEYMKGTSAYLTEVDQQRIGLVYSIFSELAAGIIVRLNTGQAIQLLDKKPEILNYYGRKVAVMQQNALNIPHA